MKKNPNPILVLIGVFACSLASGCASIVKGTTQAIPVASNPSGATIKLDGNTVGQTPTSIEVKRKGDHLVTLEKDGYETESVAITRNVGGAVFGNIIAGGLVGWGVDAISGAQYNLSPATITLNLRPRNGSSTSSSSDKAAEFVQSLRKLDELHEGKKISDEEYAKSRMSLIEKYSSPNGQPQPPPAPVAAAGGTPSTAQAK